MKKFVATLIVACFLAAGCTPEMARVGAIGAVMGGVAGMVAISAYRDRSVAGQNAQVAHAKIGADHAENMRALEINGVSGGYRALNGIPSAASLRTTDMPEGRKATLAWKPLARPQNNRHSVNNGGGESAFCRAGREAALSGTQAACESGDASDYCRCYEAAKEGR